MTSKSLRGGRPRLSWPGHVSFWASMLNPSSLPSLILVVILVQEGWRDHVVERKKGSSSTAITP
jgi:hypothetical protein